MTQSTTALMVLLALCCAVSAEAQTPDETAIRQQLAGYAAARERGDGAAQAAFYTDDADELRTRTRKMIAGRAAIERDLALAPNAARKFTFRVESVRFITPDVALAETEFFGSASTPNGHASYLFARRGGRWLIEAGRITGYPENVPATVVVPGLQAAWKARQQAADSKNVEGWNGATAGGSLFVQGDGSIRTRDEQVSMLASTTGTTAHVLDDARSFGEDAGVTIEHDQSTRTTTMWVRQQATWKVVSSQSSPLNAK